MKYSIPSPIYENLKMKFFKVEAENDVMYFKAPDLNAAIEKFYNICGDVPDLLLTWTEVSEIPDGEEIL